MNSFKSFVNELGFLDLPVLVVYVMILFIPMVLYAYHNSYILLVLKIFTVFTVVSIIFDDLDYQVWLKIPCNTKSMSFLEKIEMLSSGRIFLFCLLLFVSLIFTGLKNPYHIILFFHFVASLCWTRLLWLSNWYTISVICFLLYIISIYKRKYILSETN